jgi:3-oxoacyl-[acyl-carrier protein] reductase
MDLGLRGKAAVVTGGSRGIGRAVAMRLADEGANVAICARGEAPLRESEQELRARGVAVYAAVCDVTSKDSLDGFLDAARERLGAVDILVNNASGFNLSDDDSGWAASLDTDLMAAVRATWRVVPWMAEAGGGAIVHISSIAGLEAGWPPPYAVAKAALVSHAATSAASLAPRKIRVNTVAPGSIEFPGGIWDRSRETNPDLYAAILHSIPWGRLGTAEEVADVVAFIASPRASWVTGACITVDGGQHRGNV